jgi:hypothetical protein
MGSTKHLKMGKADSKPICTLLPTVESVQERKNVSATCTSQNSKVIWLAGQFWGCFHQFGGCHGYLLLSYNLVGSKNMVSAGHWQKPSEKHPKNTRVI